MESQVVASRTDSSNNSPQRLLPTGLTISSFLPFGRQQPPVASPVKRKPLPPNALLTPVNPNLPVAVSPLNGQIKSPDSRGLLSPELVVRDLDQFPRGLTPLAATGPGFSIDRQFQQPSNGAPKGEHDNSTPGVVAKSAEIPSSIVPRETILSTPPRRKPTVMAAMAAAAPPNANILTRSFTTSSIDTRPKTPGNKISNFFTWKNSSPGSDSSSTEISDGRSPIPSPMLTSPQTSAFSSRSIPSAIDVHKANASMMLDPAFTPAYTNRGTMSDSDLVAKIGLLEGELREISTELAGSIKREMDLEDLVEQLQLDNPQGITISHRTSDYFSDTSSSGRYDAPKVDEIERVKRRSEQERAQLKVTLSQKWQDERSKRKALESHVQLLEEQIAQSRREYTDLASLDSKARDLEASLEDARRRLVEERQIKENFEDLLTALRVELEQHRNERDNLRDEVVPQLKAQLDTIHETPSVSQYDYDRLEKEIRNLKQENATLVNARKIQHDLQQTSARFNPIMEEGAAVSSQSPIGLTRSNSLARMPARNSTGIAARSGSLSRSNSLSGRSQESRDSLLERVKDVEAQRDALHKAVKSLLERQSHQSREHEKRIKILELERDRALEGASPRRLGYEKEVKALREEIDQLRKRADDALMQKWQSEKGLGGLKKDLERAEQETTSLRNLLQEHDISLPDHLSSSLEEAYSQLQQDRERVQMYQDSNRSLEEERRLAQQLQESAERSEGLAAQVRQQLYTNQGLRDRLADAVSKGERNQQTSANRILELQAKLKKLEETVVLAQQQSETAVMKHEDQVRLFKDNENSQLLRIRGGLKTPSRLSPTSPRFSPKLAQTSTGPGMPLNQALKTEYLENKVKELEKALSDADKEMGEVVGRMNMAQIEVAELQGEKDEALRQTRRLQAEILAEREKVNAIMRAPTTARTE